MVCSWHIQSKTRFSKCRIALPRRGALPHREDRINFYFGSTTQHSARDAIHMYCEPSFTCMNNVPPPNVQECAHGAELKNTLSWSTKALGLSTSKAYCTKPKNQLMIFSIVLHLHISLRFKSGEHPLIGAPGERGHLKL